MQQKLPGILSLLLSLYLPDSFSLFLKNKQKLGKKKKHMTDGEILTSDNKEWVINTCKSMDKT